MTKKQAMPYMKLYTSYLDDLRLNKLPEAARWRYMQVYLLAFKSDADGELIDPETGEALTAADIAMLLRTDESAVSNDLGKLHTAGLLKQSGKTWLITRYTEEQVNQAEYRKAQAERQAKHRGKPNEVNESEQNESQAKESKERENISVKSSQVKSHEDITRESRVTDGRLTDGNSLSSESQEQSSKPPQYKEQNSDPEFQPDVQKLSEYWTYCTGQTATPYELRELDRALDSDISPVDIREKMQKTAEVNPTNKSAYFATCLKELYPQPATEATVGMILSSDDGKRCQTLETFNYLLAEHKIQPVTMQQMIEWGYIKESAEVESE